VQCGLLLSARVYEQHLDVLSRWQIWRYTGIAQRVVHRTVQPRQLLPAHLHERDEHGLPVGYLWVDVWTDLVGVQRLLPNGLLLPTVQCE
jgi:hypothetical protein